MLTATRRILGEVSDCFINNEYLGLGISVFSFWFITQLCASSAHNGVTVLFQVTVPTGLKLIRAYTSLTGKPVDGLEMGLTPW